jgi:putative PIN family toxin of toxin-antitoxin system
MRVVLDTNVLVSRFLVPNGKSARIIQYWETRFYQLLLSEPIIAECSRVLNYPRIRRKYSYTNEEMEHYISSLKAQCLMTQPEIRVEVVHADPDDNAIIECAVAGSADFIVSGDAHLQSLGKYSGIPILSPAELLLLLAQEEGE